MKNPLLPSSSTSSTSSTVVAPLLAALAAFAPSVARAGESDLAGVRTSLSLRSVFGVLSPTEGAVVTGLLVFALGCVVAVVVARRIERARDARERENADDSPSIHFGAAPEPFYTYEELLSGEYRGLRASPHAASSGRVASAPAARLANTTSPTESAPAIPADRASETQVMGEAERASVRPRKAPTTLVDALPRGADPDRTQELSRLSPFVDPSEVVAARTRTNLPPPAPAIRPIPISPPRRIAPANVSELTFDEPGTEAELPSFPLDTHAFATATASPFQSEIRLVGALEARQVSPDLGVAETQAFVLVRTA